MVTGGCWLCGVEPSVFVISMASIYLCGITWQPVGSHGNLWVQTICMYHRKLRPRRGEFNNGRDLCSDKYIYGQWGLSVAKRNYADFAF